MIIGGGSAQLPPPPLSLWGRGTAPNFCRVIDNFSLFYHGEQETTYVRWRNHWRLHSRAPKCCRRLKKRRKGAFSCLLGRGRGGGSVGAEKMERPMLFSAPSPLQHFLFRSAAPVKVKCHLFVKLFFMFNFHSNLLPFAFSYFFTPISWRHKYKTRLASRLYILHSFGENINNGKFNIRQLRKLFYGNCGWRIIWKNRRNFYTCEPEKAWIFFFRLSFRNCKSCRSITAMILFHIIVLGPVYKERGLPLCWGYPNKRVKVSSGLQANFTGRVTLSTGSCVTFFVTVQNLK